MRSARIISILLCLVITVLAGGCISEPARVIVKDGQYYLQVFQGTRLGSHDYKICSEFDSVEDIKNRIKNSDFSDRSKVNALYNVFYSVKGDDSLLPILDPDKIVIPAFNGETNYKRVGFMNLYLWCEQYVTLGGEEYLLYVDKLYYPEIMDKYDRDIASLKATLDSVKNEDGTKQTQYIQDGVQKECLTNQNGIEFISYNMTAGELEYFVLEEHYSSPTVYIFGKNETGGLFIKIYADETGRIEMNDIYELMGRMSIKKA